MINLHSQPDYPHSSIPSIEKGFVKYWNVIYSLKSRLIVIYLIVLSLVFMKIKYIASNSSFTQRYKTQTQSYSSFLMAYSDWVMGVVVFLPVQASILSSDFRSDILSSVQRLKLSWFQIQEHLWFNSVLQFRSCCAWHSCVCVYYFSPTISYEPTCPLRTVRGMFELLITGSSSHRFHWSFATKPASRSGFFQSTRASGYSRDSVRKPSFTPAFTTNSWQI